MMTIFLLLHGYGGTHPEHWLGYLANHLEDRNAHVLYPDFPNPDQPNLDEWLEHLEGELSAVSSNSSERELSTNESNSVGLESSSVKPNSFDSTEKPNSLVVAAHSLGCTLWLRYLAAHPNVRPQKVFLVAPPLNDCGIEEIATFFPLPELNLTNQADRYQIIGSDNDNFILEKEFHTLSKNLGIPLKILPGAGHVNAPMHGDWDWMNKECLKYL